MRRYKGLKGLQKLHPGCQSTHKVSVWMQSTAEHQQRYITKLGDHQAVGDPMILTHSQETQSSTGEYLHRAPKAAGSPLTLLSDL